MKIVDQIFHPKVRYHAKDFDTQEGHRFTIDLGSNKLIETGVYIHFLKGSPVDIAVDISCMSGCTRKCLFCAAANTRADPLDADEIVKQVEIALIRAGSSHGKYLSDTQESGKITFSFQGIGEPADPSSSGEVVDAIAKLRKLYSKWHKVQFSISSILDRVEALKRWSKIGLHTLQFSLHGSNDVSRNRLLGLKESTQTKIENIFSAIDGFSERSPDTQVKINYVLISGENDSDKNREELLSYFNDEKRKDYFLKISYLNDTYPGRQEGLNSSKHHENFWGECKRKHDRTYKYGSCKKLQVSCGQLASYAQPQKANIQLQQDIQTLYEDIRSGRCSLFLGAGASSTAWDAQGLAKMLYEGLDREESFEEANLSLAEIADAYEYKGNRCDVDNMIKSTLNEAKVPSAVYELPKYPWRSIYTTNYDEFIERSYERALNSGYAEKQCHPVLSLKDLQGLSSSSVPLIKLHGSISSGTRTVLSETDYIDGYIKNIDHFMNRIQI